MACDSLLLHCFLGASVVPPPANDDWRKKKGTRSTPYNSLLSAYWWIGYQGLPAITWPSQRDGRRMRPARPFRDREWYASSGHIRSPAPSMESRPGPQSVTEGNGKENSTLDPPSSVLSNHYAPRRAHPSGEDHEWSMSEVKKERLIGGMDSRCSCHPAPIHSRSVREWAARRVNGGPKWWKKEGPHGTER